MKKPTIHERQDGMIHSLNIGNAAKKSLNNKRCRNTRVLINGANIYVYILN